MGALDSELAVIDFDSPINGSEQETLQKGALLFLEQGYLIMKNAYDKKFIKKLRDEFLKEYKSYFGDDKSTGALNVGHLRKMVTLKLSGSFNAPEYYANPRIFALMRSLLGEDLIMNSMGGVVSLPKAQDQHVHRDHPNIYWTAPPLGDPNAMKQAPPYCITVGIPLIPMTKETGHTRFWPGTHLNALDPKLHDIGQGVDYEADLGTVALFDYRIIHAGMANKSRHVRPLLYNIYSKPWFRDAVNFNKQPEMIISDKDYQKVPERYRALFDWFRPLKASDQGTVGRNDPCHCGSGKRFKHCCGR